MRTIPLTKGYVTIVDDEDFGELSRHSWCAQEGANGVVYAYRASARSDHRAGAPQRVLMHRQILGIVSDPSVRVDHRNLDGLDNRRANLRPATHSQNLANVPKRRGSSAYKGVYWNRKLGKWSAYIQVDGKSRYLGVFLDEDEAARARDRAASEAFGEFARLNFP